MAEHQWKPGDVALVEGSKQPEVAFRIRDDEGISRWVVAHGGPLLPDRGWQRGPFARPLAVIDPENREQVERLTRAYWRTDNDIPTATGIDNMQKVLREFANPTPPKPDEPKDKGAVVTDVHGREWVRVADDRAGAPWVHWTPVGGYDKAAWFELEVTPEGVSTE